MGVACQYQDQGRSGLGVSTCLLHSSYCFVVVRRPKSAIGTGNPDDSLTNQLITTALSIGVSHITIHGRTRHQPSTAPVNHEAIKFAVECVKGEVPTVGNGDIWDLGDAVKMRETGVRGVMGARGLLAK